MGQAMIVCAIQTIMEVIQLTCECFSIIPRRIVKATVDVVFWKGVIDEMFSDGIYSPSRLKVVDVYTRDTCRYFERRGQKDTAIAIRRTHGEWLSTMKNKTIK